MTELLCEICSLPCTQSPCSERCRSLSRQKNAVEAASEQIEQRILSAISDLSNGTTACPGNLAFSILTALNMKPASERDALALLRSHYRKLRDSGKLRFFQKGKCVPLAKWPKGAFRLANR